MPSRFIKESICTSDTIDKLNSFEEVFFYRLIVSVDDFGRFDARPPILRSRLFPLKDLTDEVITKALLKLQEVGLIELYTVNGKGYLQIETWSQHQQTRATQSKYPGIEQRDTGTGDSFAKRGTAKTPENREIVSRRSVAKTTEKNSLITNDNKCYQMISNDNGCKQMLSNALENENENEFDNDIRSQDGRVREEETFFNEFWSAYPKQYDRKSAETEFSKINPDRDLLDRMLAALEAAKHSEQWTSDGGRFIPHAAKWLKGERWHDVSLIPSESQGSFDTKEFFDLAMQRSFK